MAILSVACCCCSLMLALITLPALLASVQSLHSEVQLESDFCRLRLRDFWTEMDETGDANDSQMRAKRVWLWGHQIANGNHLFSLGFLVVTFPTKTIELAMFVRLSMRHQHSRDLPEATADMEACHRQLCLRTMRAMGERRKVVNNHQRVPLNMG